MKKIRQYWIPAAALIGLLALLGPHFSAQDEVDCAETRITFDEPFDTTTYKSDESSVQWVGNGIVTLNHLGANFQVTEPAGMGAMMYVVDSGDFTGDGLPDLVGLDITNDSNRRLILVRNVYLDADGDGEDDDGQIFLADLTELYDQNLNCGPASITVGDYNGDGLLDFFFYKNGNDSFSYSDFVAAMYINVGTATDPDFYNYWSSPNLNFTSRFMSAGIYANWAGDHLCSVDIDGDDDVDVLVISEDKIFLIRNPGPSEFELNEFEIAELSYDQRTGFTIGRGGTSVDAADFDGDGDIDVIGGTVNDINYLVYYENDGTGNFTRGTIPIPYDNCTGTVATCVSDFNQDGYIDIFGATDAWNAGNEAHMWLQKNLGYVGGEEGDLTFEFVCLNNCQPILPEPHDVDMSAVLDYDMDGDMDVVLADANHSGDYYLIINDLAPVYNLYGEAISTNISEGLNPSVHAVTRIRMLNLDQSVLGGSADGLAVDYYVSNNGGRDWEFYARYGSDAPEESELETSGPLADYTNLPWHSFNHFGSQLVWKAVLTAEEDEMAEYTGASFETPVIDRIRFRYAYVERREYSRTSVAANVADEEGQKLELIIGGTFYFPGWEGHLRAYDVTNMTASESSYSELSTITRPDASSPDGRLIVADGVTIRWDAATLLNERDPATRVVYTAFPAETGDGMTRVDFIEGNIDLLGPKLGDVNYDNVELVSFVRGVNRDWLLGDINHSNPVILGPPSGVESQMGSGYEVFAQEWEDRPKVMFVGANDGMLHCFDVLTGVEKWGFIPHNLLPKLKNMWVSDNAIGSRYFARDVYCDGSPVVADVYINDEWRTVLICGQGPGKGSSISGGDNYYFALDVTDVEDPRPLWEMTDGSMGETWSVPAVGRVTKNGEAAWVGFVGSGYDNVAGGGRQGNCFYAFDVADGNIFLEFNAGEVNTRRRPGWSSNIANSIPGSPSIIDLDNDGAIDRVYFADIDGRLYKIDTSLEYLSADPWDPEEIYEDSRNFPIITKPAVWKDPANAESLPHVYFGTGGDDSAPDDQYYSFIGLIDDPTVTQQDDRVSWYIGDPDVLNLSEDKAVGTMTLGEKVWADPQIANSVVYFSTLTGDIETVDPCESLSGIGRLYARYVKAVAGSPVGSTAFRGASGTLENLGLEIKTRAAVTLGEKEKVGGIYKQDVYIQEFDSTIQRLSQPSGAALRVRAWREIYHIKK